MSSVISNNNSSTIADYAYFVITKYVDRITKYEQKIFTEKDPENLHQLRVGMRKLRSVLQIFDLILNLPSLITEKNIGNFAKVLGKQRDLDIIKINLETKFKANLPPQEKRNINRLINLDSSAHKNNYPQPKSILKSKKYRQLKKAILQWLKKPKYQAIASIPLEKNIPYLLLPQISKFTLQSAWLVGTKKQDNGGFIIPETLPIKNVNQLINKSGEQLHQLRKEAKKTRYQLELFTDFFPPIYKEYIKFVKESQEILGDIQDNFCLQDYLSKSISKKWSKKLPHLKQLIKEDQYKQWQKWQKLQTKFIKQNYSQELNHLINCPDDNPTEYPSLLMESLPLG